jgi:hypothetical protein
LKRREGCMDMIEVLSEQLNEPVDRILRRACIDVEDYKDI